MYNWAVINNGEITEYHHTVPQNWRHISNLVASATDLEFMRSVGWLPVRLAAVQYDETQKIIASYQYSIQSDHVLATPVLADRPAPAASSVPVINQDPSLPLDYLQSQLDRWRAALEPAHTRQIAQDLLTYDPALRADIQRSVRNFFDTLPHNNFINETITREHVEQVIVQRLQQLIDHVLDPSVSHERRIERWWTDVSRRAEQELQDQVRNHRHELFRELNDLRWRMKRILHASSKTWPLDSEIEKLRFERDIRLMETDWTQLKDVQDHMTQELRDRWIRYRQALRDMPQIYADTGRSDWPEL